MPYFFLSYAHTPKQDPDDNLDPDRWVFRLYKDLCGHILQLTSAQPAEAGFMDREMRLGAEWPNDLVRALASCRVFVPLYSPRYFQSDQCGREWFAFARRIVDHAAQVGMSGQAIVPALWVTVNPSTLPEVARSLQFDHQALGNRYNAEGFYGIMKLSRYRRDYETAVYKLAQHIVQVAQRTRIAAAELSEYESLHSAFGSSDPNQRAGHRIQLTVAALDAQSLPNGRRSFYYGPSPRDWNPYRPRCVQPLAEYAARLTACLGYQPSITTVDDQPAAPTAQDSAASPGLVLVDPWETMSDRHRARLQRFDTQSKQWVSVMVPWNVEDEETTGAEHDLKQRLNSSIRHMLDRIPPTCRAAGDGLPTLGTFRDTLPRMVHAMSRRYFKYAPAFPPSGPTIERPRLRGPDLERPGETQ